MSDDVIERLQQKRYALANAESFLRTMREIRDDLADRGVLSIAYDEEWTGGRVEVGFTINIPDGAAIPTVVFDAYDWEMAKLRAEGDPRTIHLAADFSTRVNGNGSTDAGSPCHPCEAA